MQSLPILLTASLLALGTASTTLAQDDGAPLVAFEDAFPDQTDFDRPLQVSFHPSDRQMSWVVEQTGKIWRVPTEGGSERSLVVDFSERALHPRNGGGNEEGLLGFAFAPDFAESRHVFVYYSFEFMRIPGDKNATSRRARRDTVKRQSIVDRYTVVEKDGAMVFDLYSRLEILRVDQPFGNHNGGTITFGPDQMLYIVFGDGGAANDMAGNGQNLWTLLATVSRIDVSESTALRPYQIPADNPFIKQSTTRPEIWAYGLRNPWRIAFDRETGTCWYADVGQNIWEEVGILAKGGNHGWPLMEGFHEFPPKAERSEKERAKLVAPIAEYDHRDKENGGLSVTGGAVYRGSVFGGELNGSFVYGDYVTRHVFAVEQGPEGGRGAVRKIGRCPELISGIFESPAGELLFTTYAQKSQRQLKGRIFRMVRK